MLWSIATGIDGGKTFMALQEGNLLFIGIIATLVVNRALAGKSFLRQENKDGVRTNKVGSGPYQTLSGNALDLHAVNFLRSGKSE